MGIDIYNEDHERAVDVVNRACNNIINTLSKGNFSIGELFEIYKVCSNLVEEINNAIKTLEKRSEHNGKVNGDYYGI